MKAIFRILIVAALALAGQAQAQGADPQEVLQALFARNGAGASNSPAVPQLAQMSEIDLGRKIAAWTTAGSHALAVERFRDGFSIEGNRVLDPEGAIVNFAVNSRTGDAAYLVQMAPNAYVLKLMHYGAGPAISMATLTRQFGNWNVETVTGVRVNGPRLNVTSTGFIIARANAVFRYQPGQGLVTFALPDAYTLAAHQNGDVGGTDWVLLEKRQDTKDKDGGSMGSSGLGKLFSSVKDIGSTLGVAKGDSDYALYQMKRQTLVPIGISLTNKEATFMSQCQQRNRWVAKCAETDSRESLYLQDGSPNRSHYYWRVSWYSTPTGPVAVLMENSISKIEALDLDSGRRAVLFERTLGIGDWSTRQAPDGRIQVRAKLGFEAAENLDVSATLASANEVPASHP